MARQLAELLPLPEIDATPDDEGWRREVLRYRVTPRRKPKFQSILDVSELFSDEGSHTVVTTEVRPDAGAGAECLRVDLEHTLQRGRIRERFVGHADEQGRVRPVRFERTNLDGGGTVYRDESADFTTAAATFPDALYPEVLLPFLMRGVPADKNKRALYAWTSDRFLARVYYETRKQTKVATAGGKVPAHELWMYPDLNDWIALGGVLTKLAKPLLPRYTFWVEAKPTRRLVRFEGPSGPPGAPEIVLELDGGG